VTGDFRGPCSSSAAACCLAFLHDLPARSRAGSRTVTRQSGDITRWKSPTGVAFPMVSTCPLGRCPMLNYSTSSAWAVSSGGRAPAS